MTLYGYMTKIVRSSVAGNACAVFDGTVGMCDNSISFSEAGDKLCAQAVPVAYIDLSKSGRFFLDHKDRPSVLMAEQCA